MHAPRRRLAWFLRVIAGLLLFWIAFRDVDPSALGNAFAAADPAWLVAAVLSVFVTVACVVMRWRVLLGAAARHSGVLASAVIASQVANIVAPFRLGDAVRIGAVSRALNVSPAAVLGSVAVERLFDALLLAVTAGLLAAFGALPPFAETGMWSLAAGIGAVLAAAVVLMRFRRVFESPLDKIGRALPARVRDVVWRQAALLLTGVERISRANVAALAFIWSGAVIAGSIFTAWLVMRAFDLAAPAVSAAVVVIVLQIGTVAVPVPGAVGISQVLTVQTLRLWGIDEATALAYALMLYLIARGPKLAVLPFALSALAPKTAEPA